jgi:DNA-binding NtrC family response regulator
MSEKPKAKILLVDDDAGTLETNELLVKGFGYDVVTAKSPLEAMGLASKSAFDMVLMEVVLKPSQGGDGYDLLGFIKDNLDEKRRQALKGKDGIRSSRDPGTPVVIITHSVTEALVTKCKELGALDVLQKAGFDNNDLKALINRAVESRRPPEPFFGTNPDFLKILDFLDKVARTDKPVLLTGETGVGKEIMAKRIVAKSRRSNRKYKTFNCSGVSKDIAESELFGHVKGAFTGAISDRDGHLKDADGGTLFLDEIAETDPSFQAKLLRAIQFGECLPVGSDKTEHFDVRFLAATNRDLQAEMESKTFRQDLYYRFPFVVKIPPLRERVDALPALIDHILDEVALDPAGGLYLTKGNTPKIRDDAMELLCGFSWPGNIRQLRNVLDYAVVMANGVDTIIPEHLPDYILQAPPARSAAAAPAAAPAVVAGRKVPDGWPNRVEENGEHVTFKRLEKVEALEILKAMVEVDGVINQGAKSLRIDRNTLKSKINKYGIKAILELSEDESEDAV